jgi:hypothetical protein
METKAMLGLIFRGALYSFLARHGLIGNQSLESLQNALVGRHIATTAH